MPTTEKRAAERLLDHWVNQQSVQVQACVARCRREGLSDEALISLLMSLTGPDGPDMDTVATELEAADAALEVHRKEMEEAAGRRAAAEVVERERAAAVALQREQDARCVRYRHHERAIGHCENPRCPALHPEAWQAFTELETLLPKI